MIKITIELFRHGNPDDREILGTAKIYNDLSGTPERGNYKYKLSKKSGKIWRKGEIKGFARKSRSAWRLLYLVLKDIYEET